MTCEDILRGLFMNDPAHVALLRAVRSLDLPDGWVGAGYVRSAVWDHLSGFHDKTKVDDVDVVYYAAGDLSEALEKHYDALLTQALPGIPWSCKNQARMHLKQGLASPYADTADGLRHWTETATAVAVRLDRHDGIEILAPFGLDDLFQKVVRPTPFFETRREEYIRRIESKNWQDRWPDLRFMGI